MKTSGAGRKFIEQIEENGVAKLRAYNDGTGVWTIGFGHTSAAGLPHVYSASVLDSTDQADQILSSDLASVEADVLHHVRVELTQAQFDTLVSWDFNTGALDRASLLRVLNAGNYDCVPDELMKWIYPEVARSGLIKRRRGECAMWSGDYDKAMEIAKS